MNKLTPQAHTFRTFQPYLALFLLLFLVSCHHKTAPKQAKIEKQKEKTFQAEQKEMAEKKMEKKNKEILSAKTVNPKKVETTSPTKAEKVGSIKVETPNPEKKETPNPQKDELAGLTKVENLYKPKVETPQIQAKTAETKKPAVETSPKGPLSKNAEKTPVSAMSKPSASVAPVTPRNINVSPMNMSPINASNSAKMGNCISFFPNKAIIADDSRACLKEIGTYLKNNKNLRLAISANVLSTEKVADAVVLKTERAKTVRNFLIQSGIEASRLTIKLSDSKDAAAIVLTPDDNEKRKK